MKSEPDAFSIDDLMRVQKEPWTGVRNYLARNYMRDHMRVGDPVLFYHSSCEMPGIVGLAEVASKPFADPTQFDAKSPYFDPKASFELARWQLVEVKFVRKLKRVISLDDMRAVEFLHAMPVLQRGNRLSILPITLAQYAAILHLETP